MKDNASFVLSIIFVIVDMRLNKQILMLFRIGFQSNYNGYIQ